MNTNEYDRTSYSINQVIQYSNIGRTKIYAEIKAGRLKAKKIGSRTIVPALAFQEWVNNLPDFK